MSDHRARQRLLAYGAAHPGIWDAVDSARAGGDIGGSRWPEYTYLPLEVAGTVVAEIAARAGIRATPDALLEPASELATLAAWRMTQGIYRFDPALYAALADTPISGDIPAQVLLRLPEWCVYVELDGLAAPMSDGSVSPVHGAWAWLDRPMGDPRAPSAAIHDLLTIALDIDGPLPMIHVPLTGQDLRGALDGLVDEWRDAVARGNTTIAPRADWIDQVMPLITPILSLLLYLCSEAPDLSRQGRPATPANPVPVKTRRRGERIFPAAGPAQWDVGVRIGAALRDAYQREQTGGPAAPTGRTMRPHVRRAHWHTVLSGPRLRNGQPIPSDQRRRDLRWMPPLPINVGSPNDLPAVIRPVKQD